MSLRDKQAARRIQARIDRAEEGNFGDHKSVGDGVSEIVILLGGGDKSSQTRDIELAQDLARQLKD